MKLPNTFENLMHWYILDYILSEVGMLAVPFCPRVVPALLCVYMRLRACARARVLTGKLSLSASLNSGFDWSVVWAVWRLSEQNGRQPCWVRHSRWFSHYPKATEPLLKLHEAMNKGGSFVVPDSCKLNVNPEWICRLSCLKCTCKSIVFLLKCTRSSILLSDM